MFENRKSYDPRDWYWVIGDDATKVYYSHASVRDYVPVSDPAFIAWQADGSVPQQAPDEATVGRFMAQWRLRPIPQGVLDGYLDELTRLIIMDPSFRLWVDLYQAMMKPTPNEAQIMAHIRSLL